MKPPYSTRSSVSYRIVGTSDVRPPSSTSSSWLVSSEPYFPFVGATKNLFCSPSSSIDSRAAFATLSQTTVVASEIAAAISVDAAATASAAQTPGTLRQVKVEKRKRPIDRAVDKTSESDVFRRFRRFFAFD